MGPTNNEKKLMMSYFYGCDVYSAEKIDKQEKPEIVKQCLEDGLLVRDNKSEFPLYILTDKGRNYLK